MQIDHWGSKQIEGVSIFAVTADTGHPDAPSPKKIFYSDVESLNAFMEKNRVKGHSEVEAQIRNGCYYVGGKLVEVDPEFVKVFKVVVGFNGSARECFFFGEGFAQAFALKEGSLGKCESLFAEKKDGFCFIGGRRIKIEDE